jgi:hypothetical protein
VGARPCNRRANLPAPRGRGRVVREHFAEEQPYLKALPTMPFSAVLTLDRLIARDGMVSVGGNLYSVPDSSLQSPLGPPGRVPGSGYALELRQRANHMKNQPPLRGRRVEGFGQAAKPDTLTRSASTVLINYFIDRARLIELPHDQRVAAARELERSCKAGRSVNRTGHLLGENLGAPSFGQRDALQGKVLVYG